MATVWTRIPANRVNRTFSRGPRLALCRFRVFQTGRSRQMKNVLIKFVVCTIAFSGGIAWGIAAEASETGVTLATMFGG